MAPALARKVLIYASIDGLVLQPLGQRGQRPTSATKIAYKDNSIGPALRDGGEFDEAGKNFEAFGVVGKPEECRLALCAWTRVTIIADAVFCRSSNGFKILFSDIHNQTTTGSANPGQIYIRCDRSRPDPSRVSFGSRGLDYKYTSYDPARCSWRAWPG